MRHTTQRNTPTTVLQSAVAAGPVPGFACLLLLAAAPPLCAQTDTALLRPVLEARYAQQDSAIARRDLAGFLATLAPWYVVELRDGQRFTRPGVDSAIARDMRQTHAVSSAGTVIESLRVRGDTVWAVVVHRADRVLRDAEGVPHRWENGVRHEEGWVRVGPAWGIAVLRERDQLYLRRDGEPVR